VLAVPRSMAMSLEMRPNKEENIKMGLAED
jgi:hypothetical protein